MSVSASELRSAATIAEDRLVLANKVKSLRDEIVAGSDEIRAEKAADFQSAVEQLESCDSQYHLVKSLENANAMVEKLSQQPQRPVSKGYEFARVNSATGELIDAGSLASRSDSEVLSSRDYGKAFESFLQARGKLDRVKSHGLRNLLETYGKGGDTSLGDHEIFMPFQKDLTTGSTAAGSNAIAPDFRFDIITPRTVRPAMSSICRTITTNVNQVTFPKNTDATRGTYPNYGTVFRGLTMSETPSGSTVDTGPFSQLIVPVNTGSLFTDLSMDFFQDAPGMSNYIQTEAGKAFAAVVDDQVINGVKASTQCDGIAVNTSTIANYVASGAAGGYTGTNPANKVIDTYFKFKTSYAQNLTWVMARATHGKIGQFLDSTGRSLFVQSGFSGLVDGLPQNILSTPVVYNEFMPAFGTSANLSVVLGDFSEYILLMRQGFTVLVDDVSRQYANRARFTMRYRFGGAPRDTNAFMFIKESVS